MSRFILIVQQIVARLTLIVMLAMKSMVLDTSNLLSFLRISILLSLLSLEGTR